MSSVIVRSSPPCGFYADHKPDILPDISYRRLRAIPPYRRRLAEAELDSGSIELDNSDGFLSDLFSSPPFGIAVSIYDDAAGLLVDAYLAGVQIQQSILILLLEA